VTLDGGLVVDRGELWWIITVSAVCWLDAFLAM
jgi:hypothetical protein